MYGVVKRRISGSFQGVKIGLNGPLPALEWLI